MAVRAKECSVVGTLGLLAGWQLWWGRRGRGGRRGAPRCWRKLGLRNRSCTKGREGEALKVGVLAFQSSNFLAMGACDWVSSLEVLPCTCLALQAHCSNGIITRPAEHLGAENWGNSKRRGLLGSGNCHRAYARFLVADPAGTGALHVPRRERSVCSCLRCAMSSVVPGD